MGSSDIITEPREIETSIEQAAEFLKTGEVIKAHNILVENHRLDLPTITRIKNNIQLVIAEWHLGNISNAFEYSLETKRLGAGITDNYLLAQIHSNHALVLRQLAKRTDNSEHYDSAIIELTASSFYFERAGVIHYQARVENNLAILQLQLGKFDDALSSAHKAIRLTRSIKDESQLAFMYDTIAQIYIEMDKLDSAYKAIQTALKLLPDSRETKAWLDISCTSAKILFRFGNYYEAKDVAENAVQVALKLDHRTLLIDLYLLLLEEAEPILLPMEIISLIQKAYPLLTSDKQKVRLAVAAHKLLEFLSPSDEKAHIDKLTTRLEKESLRRALANEKGSVTRAAAAMDYSYQRVDYLLENNYLDLKSERTPRIKRKKSIVKKFQKK